MSRTAPGRRSGPVIWLASWWWPERPARVPKAGAAGLVAGLGAALFGVSAIALKTGTLGWDERLFRILNQVPAAASVLTLVSYLFRPAGIIAVVVLAVVYVVARNRRVLPVAAGAAAAGIAWGLAHVAKAMADRPRPYEVIAGAVLRQQPAHGTSFPSSPAAVTLAVAIALVPFLGRPLAATGIGYAVLAAGPGCTWACTIPWMSWPGRHRHGRGRRDLAGARDAAPPRGPVSERPHTATEVREPGAGPESRRGP